MSSIWTDNVIAFTSRTETRSLDEYVDHIITEAVTIAAAHYRAGEPGRGAFILARLGLRLTRLEQVHQQQGVPQ